MPKELLNLEMERDNLGQKWGFTIQGGADLALTAKVASVKVSEVEVETRNVLRRIGCDGNCYPENNLSLTNCPQNTTCLLSRVAISRNEKIIEIEIWCPGHGANYQITAASAQGHKSRQQTEIVLKLVMLNVF